MCSGSGLAIDVNVLHPLSKYCIQLRAWAWKERKRDPSGINQYILLLFGSYVSYIGLSSLCLPFPSNLPLLMLLRL